jgi:hypothetical protein
MKKVIVILSLMLCFFGASAQRQGIGVRLGDPMGVTYKRYLPGNKAVEFGLGSASPGWHQSYYEKSFKVRHEYDDFRYRSHSVESTLYLQGRYLLHYEIPIEGMEGKLEWYWGVGAILKFAKVKYRFQDLETTAVDSDTRSDIDLGPEGIGGMEYTFQDVPVTIFGDISLMLELVDRPTLRPFAGIGARYNF